jgi:hypothetical protein
MSPSSSGRRISQAKNQREAGSMKSADARRYIPEDRSLLKDLQFVIQHYMHHMELDTDVSL